MDDADYDAPDTHVVAGCDGDRRVIGIGRHQKATSAFVNQSFDGKRAVQIGYDHVVVSGRQRTVDDHQVAIQNTQVDHAVAFGPSAEGGSGIFHQRIQIQTRLCVIIGRAGETGTHAGSKDG